MSLRRVKDKADSLGLLFDTICNAFGGIIVIAVLVALMTHEIKQSEDSVKAAQSSQEMVARRLAHAQQELNEARQALVELQARVAAQDPHLKETIQKQADLLREVQALQIQIATSQSELDNVRQTEAISDPGLKKQELSQQQAGQSAQTDQVQQEITAKDLQVQQLEEQSADLVTQIKEASKPVVKNLRLPKEHATEKDPWFVIIQNGEIFSKNKLQSGIVEKNPDIFHVESSGDDETWIPIRGRGIAGADHAAILQLLSNIRQSDRYISFIVYPDSFSSFITMRNAAISEGVEYGWLPEEPSTSVIFSSTGTVPQPQ